MFSVENKVEEDYAQACGGRGPLGPKTYIFCGANLHTFLMVFFGMFISPGGGRCDERKTAGL